jgi:hypothetical protein
MRARNAEILSSVSQDVTFLAWFFLQFGTLSYDFLEFPALLSICIKYIVYMSMIGSVKTGASSHHIWTDAHEAAQSVAR